MNKFAITTDYTADYDEEFFATKGVDRVILPFSVDNIEYDIRTSKISYHDFYQKLRDGSFAVTSQVSQFDAMAIFKKHLDAGEDVLHFCFSSGVSSSFDNFAPTLKELREAYPNRKINVIDSLSGAGTLGIMIAHAVEMKESGTSYDELLNYFEENKLKYHHYFIVDDLKFLKRSGRINAIEATFGTILGIKPVLELNSLGKINQVAKPKGGKKARAMMADLVSENINIDKCDSIIVGHGDNTELATKLSDAILEKSKVKIKTFNVSYLIGSHAGPDCLAVFFLGKNKRK